MHSPILQQRKLPATPAGESFDLWTRHWN